jgi:cytidylate kinase
MAQKTRYVCPTRVQFSRAHLDPEIRLLASARLPLIIGVTGPPESGKTSVARHLAASRRFAYTNLGAQLRSRAIHLGYEHPRWRDLGRLAEEWRAVAGADVLAREMAASLCILGPACSCDIVVDGILHKAEAEHLSQLCNFRLVAVTASQARRYGWQKDQSCSGEALSRDEFREHDDYQRGRGQVTSPCAPCVDAIVDSVQACLRICNDGTLADLYRRTDLVVSTVMSSLPRHVGFSRR